jgi:ATP-dependent Clp protease adapter protein ClpS
MFLVGFLLLFIKDINNIAQFVMDILENFYLMDMPNVVAIIGYALRACH